MYSTSQTFFPGGTFWIFCLNIPGKLFAKHPCKAIIQSALVSANITMFSFRHCPSAVRPFPKFLARESTSVYVSQLYSPETSFLKTFPFACTSSSSLSTSLVPRHLLYGYSSTDRLLGWSVHWCYYIYTLKYSPVLIRAANKIADF